MANFGYWTRYGSLSNGKIDFGLYPSRESLMNVVRLDQIDNLIKKDMPKLENFTIYMTECGDVILRVSGKDDIIKVFEMMFSNDRQKLHNATVVIENHFNQLKKEENGMKIRQYDSNGPLLDDMFTIAKREQKEHCLNWVAGALFTFDLIINDLSEKLQNAGLILRGEIGYKEDGRACFYSHPETHEICFITFSDSDPAPGVTVYAKGHKTELPTLLRKIMPTVPLWYTKIAL